MITDEIKKANITALKEHNENARNIYGVVLNKIKLKEIEKRAAGEAIKDEDIYGVLQKTVKELQEEINGYYKVGNEARAKQIEEQARLVEQFLPKMMSAEEIEAIINSLEDKSVPFVMKHFKQKYAGKCDMALVQQTLKKITG